MTEARPIRAQVEQVTADLVSALPLTERHLLVMGISTSEVMGEKIGTAGSAGVAETLLDGALAMQKRYGYHLAFQCCEHLNRALVTMRETAALFSLTEVSAVPIPGAGGAMAAHAYAQLSDPVLVESVQADAGIDIGDTLIGMHLKPVAVPVRPSLSHVGEAHVTMAITRPKLIGGARAVYVMPS